MMDVQNSWMTVSPWSPCTHARRTRENFGDESSLDTHTKGSAERVWRRSRLASKASFPPYESAHHHPPSLRATVRSP